MIIYNWDNQQIIFPLEQSKSENNNNKLIILKYGKNIIKLPFSVKNKRYELEFNYYYDTSQICRKM